jgi:hypothetical protein
MARNGSGTYVLPAGNPVVTGTTISSTWANNTLTDIAAALTGSISTDGQTLPIANLPMGGYIHTGVGNATLGTQYAAAGQVQSGSITYLTSVSGTNNLLATAALGMNAYVTGQVFSFISAGANTGVVTLNINAIGITPVKKNGTLPLAAYDIPAGAAIQVMYDGTNFQLISAASSGGGAVANGAIYENSQEILASYTITTAKNGFSVGPITIDTGATVTVPTGSRWVIL